MTVPVVELVGLARTFPGEPPVEALKPTDLVVEPGEYVSIVGASGSGKSTLLHLLGLLDRPTDGSYRLEGVDVASLSDARRTGLRGRRIGFVFQAFHLLPHRSVTDNVALGLLYRAAPRRQRRERAIAALRRVGLGHRLDFSPTKLSGGERQRVAIARALVGDPALLLCDEPTGNLDSLTTASVLDLFDELHDEGLTLIVITHDPEVSQRAGRTLLMRDGVLADAKPALR